MDNWVSYLKYFYKEVLYTVVVAIYLMFLYNLNKVLLDIGFTEFYRILQYDSWKPVRYFVYAIILFIIGVLLIINIVKCFKRYGRFEYETNSFGEVLGGFIAIFVIVILLILIIIFINEPIFQAILTAIAVGGIYLSI